MQRIQGNGLTYPTFDQIKHLAYEVSAGNPSAIQDAKEISARSAANREALGVALETANQSLQAQIQEITRIETLPKRGWVKRALLVPFGCFVPEIVADEKEKADARRGLPGRRAARDWQTQKVEELIQQTRVAADRAALADKEMKTLESRQAQIGKIGLVMDPNIELENLVAKLAEFVDEFDRNFPARQSEYVRRCLADLPVKIETIKKVNANKQAIEGKAAVSSKERDWQVYFQIQGLVHTLLMSNELQTQRNECDKQFYKTLLHKMCETDLVSMIDAVKRYKTLGLHLISPDDLEQQEIAAFNSAYAEMEELVNRYKIELDDRKEAGVGSDTNFEKLHQHSRELLAAMREKNLNAPHFDRKFRTEILKTSAVLLRGASGNSPEPADEAEYYKRYRTYLALEKSGKSSLGKKAFGAMFMFLGAALMTVGIAAKVCTFGLSTPLSTVTLVGGAGLFLAGVGLFKSGMRSGLAKNIYKIEKLSRDLQVRAKFHPNPSARDKSIFDEQYYRAKIASQSASIAPSAPLSYEDLSPGLSLTN